VPGRSALPPCSWRSTRASEHVAAAARDWTDGDGPPLIIEASGAGPALKLATEAVSHAGRVVMVGMSAATAPVRPGIFPEKEIDVPP